MGLPLVHILWSALAGQAEFSRMLGDDVLKRSAAVTVFFSAATVTLEMLLGLLFAILLNESFRGRGWARAVALIPWALPTAVMAMSWRWMFNDTYGVVNDLLMRAGVINTSLAWLGRPATAFWAAVFADLWKTTPFVTIILLAGLQSIPKDLYEAMRMDGAGTWKRFRLVTLPLLRPALALALLFRLIQAFGVFDLVWVLTGGGPAGSTRTVSLYIYDTIFRYLDVDYGAVITVTFMIAVFAVSGLLGRMVRGRTA